MPSQEASHARAAAAATIGTNLTRGMSARGLNNRQLGELVGSTEHQVWRWSKGKHVPAVETLVRLAEVLFDGDMAELYADPARNVA